MKIDTKEIKKLIDLLEDSPVTEIEVKDGAESIRLTFASDAYLPDMDDFDAEFPTQHIPAHTNEEEIAPASKDVEEKMDYHQVLSPMVGTYYSSHSPDADAFVQVGQKVKIGDTLCIIEAMKMMNQIEADKSGTIKAILLNNDAPVEFEQPLFLIEE